MEKVKYSVNIPIEENKASTMTLSKMYYVSNVNQYNNVPCSVQFEPSDLYDAMKKNTVSFNLVSRSIDSNGTYSIYDYRDNESQLGWWQVNVNVPQGEDVNNTNVNANNTITQSGQYNIPSGYTGFNSFTVNIPISSDRNIFYDIADTQYDTTHENDAVWLYNTATVPQNYSGQGNVGIQATCLSKTITSNGVYDIRKDRTANSIVGYWKVNVNVPTTLVDNANVNANNNITSNGTFNVPSGKTGFNSFTVNIPSDIDNDTPGTNGVITSNGTYSVPQGKSGWNSFSVNVPQTIQGVNPLQLYYVDSGVSNHPIHSYMYHENTTGEFIYIEPKQYLELWLQQSNGDVEFVVFYYNSTGSKYPLTNATSCYYYLSTPDSSAPNPGDTVIFKDSVTGDVQLTINWYERYFAGTNRPGLMNASITFPSGLIGSTFRLPFFDN